MPKLPPITPEALLIRLRSADWQLDLHTAMRRLDATIAIDRKRLDDRQTPMGCHLSLQEATVLSEALTMMCALVLTSGPQAGEDIPTPPAPQGRN